MAIINSCVSSEKTLAMYLMYKAGRIKGQRVN